MEWFTTKKVTIKKPSTIQAETAKLQPAVIESQMLQTAAKIKRKEEKLANIMKGD